MKLYLKVIGCSCYTCLPQKFSAAQTALKMALGSGTDAPPVAQRLLTNTWPKTMHNNKHTSKHYQKLRNGTSLHQNSTLNYSKTILRVTTIAWT